MGKSLLVIAHADDETLGMGGTIAKQVAAGEEFYGVLLTKYDTRDVKRQHLGHWADALKVLGLSVDRFSYGPYPDQRFEAFPLSDIARNISQVIEHVQPETVYTHWIGDLNRDHRLAAEATMVACRPHTAPSVKRLLSFEVPSSTEWGPWDAFKPNWFEVIEDEHFLRKKDAFKCYATEFRPWPHPRSYVGLEKRAAYWASVAGVQPYAEAFRLLREVR